MLTADRNKRDLFGMGLLSTPEQYTDTPCSLADGTFGHLVADICVEVQAILPTTSFTDPA